VSVTDSADGTIYRDTAVVVVTNLPPVLQLVSPTPIPEGSRFTRSISFADPGADIWTAQVDYGDGSDPVAFTGITPATGLNLSHPYADDGTFTVRITLSDGHGGVATQSFALTVTNVAPSVNAGPDLTSRRGPPHAHRCHLDPGAADPLTFLWVVTASNGQVVPTGHERTFNFTPLDNGTYQVVLTVRDEDLATGMIPSPSRSPTPRQPWR